MKVLIIDGQGGGIGKNIIEQLKISFPKIELIALGTNSIATAAMLRVGADFGATGENPVVYNCKDADIIIGPIGIIVANSLMGEITPSMAQAVGESKAKKILLPMNKCNTFVIGVQELTLSEYIALVVEEVDKLIKN
ncbi:MAG: DUF3842 family protein [Clostridium sp.]|uniref:DUF3842 family protein n=1 Tax=Clostridium sp. TaxID=1506 RepID=UPI0030360CDC